MRNYNILILFFFITPQLLFAQQFLEENFLGEWLLIEKDKTPLQPQSQISLLVSETELLLKNNFDEVSSEWKFSKDKTEIYCSNDNFDEEWKILKLDRNNLIIKDKGAVLVFKKIKAYEKPQSEILSESFSESVEIEKESQLIGDWMLYKTDNYSLKGIDYWISFRPKGSMTYHTNSFNTPATWSVNSDAKSITVEAFNGLSEKWDLIKMSNKELEFRCGDKYYSYKRK